MTDQHNVKVEGNVTVSSPPPPPPKSEDPKPPGFWTVVAMVSLILLGASLIGVGLGLWIAGGDQDPSTTSTNVTSSATTTSSGTTTTGGGTGTAPSSPQTQKGGSDQTVTTDPADLGTRSDTLTVALLGLGAVLLLIGMLFRRITEITLPGGAVIKLPGGAGIGAALGELARVSPEAAADPGTMRELALTYLEPLTPEGTTPEEAFGEDYIQAAVDAALQQEGDPGPLESSGDS